MLHVNFTHVLLVADCNFIFWLTQLVNFRASVGQSHTQSIPLRNAGNIALEVSLEVTHWPDFFTVMPMQLMIEPGGQSDCLIKFSPNQTTAAAFERFVKFVRT